MFLKGDRQDTFSISDPKKHCINDLYNLLSMQKIRMRRL